MKPLLLLIAAVVACASTLQAQTPTSPAPTPATAEQLYALYQERDYFALEKSLGDLDPKDERRLFFEGQLASAFLRDAEAEEKLNRFLQLPHTAPDWRKETWLTLGYNRKRRGVYGMAAQAFAKALEETGAPFTAAMRLEVEQDFATANALNGSLPQTREAYVGPSTVNASRGLGGFIYLDVRVNGWTEQMVLDTGANDGAVSESFARHHHLRLLPDPVECISSVSKVISARVGLADTVQIGKITFHQVVFLVFPDADLALRGPDATPFEIIGLPVILGCERIQVAADGSSVEVGAPTNTALPNSATQKNLALDGLMPLVLLCHFVQTAQDQALHL